MEDKGQEITKVKGRREGKTARAKSRIGWAVKT